MATKAQVKKCIETIAPLAQEQYRKGKKILPSVCIAQACCESAYLTSPKMIRANAVFGIKVGRNKVKFGKAWKGKAYSTKTKECYDGKSYVEITDMFRAYDTIAESVEDYYDMLCSSSRYRKAVGASGWLETIQAIKNGGYATSPTYVNTISSIIKKNNLMQYDVDNADYIVGKNYHLIENMYVRKTAGGSKKKFSELSKNAQENGYKDSLGYGILKKGTVVTCKGIEYKNGAIWLQIPSGYVCAKAANGRIYIP